MVLHSVNALSLTAKTARLTQVTSVILVRPDFMVIILHSAVQFSSVMIVRLILRIHVIHAQLDFMVIILHSVVQFSSVMIVHLILPIYVILV